MHAEVAAAVEDLAEDLAGAPEAGAVDGGVAADADGVGVGPEVEEELHQVLVARVRRDEQGRLPELVERVHVDA